MRVRDLMIKEFNTVTPDATIREAAALLRTGKGRGEGGWSSLLVMEGGRLAGIVTITDILKAALPLYMAGDPHLAHLGWDGLLEQHCKQVQDKPVREVMQSRVVTVDEDAVLTEAVEHLIHQGVHSLPVMRGETVIGVLYLSDLAHRVFAQLEAEQPS